MKNILVSRLENCYLDLSRGTAIVNYLEIEKFMAENNIFVLKTSQELTERFIKSMKSEKIIYDYIYCDKDRTILNMNNIKVEGSYVGENQEIECIKDLYRIDDFNVYTISSMKKDLDMIRAYNGYSIRNSEQEIMKSSLGTVDNVEQLAKMIRFNQTLKR
ncbi:MAG: hypothetical protein PHQ64_01860 [Bacilli bacterium]|nr:hypothetical protein [Bacilli bacterium]